MEVSLNKIILNVTDKSYFSYEVLRSSYPV